MRAGGSGTNQGITVNEFEARVLGKGNHLTAQRQIQLCYITVSWSCNPFMNSCGLNRLQPEKIGKDWKVFAALKRLNSAKKLGEWGYFLKSCLSKITM